MPVPGRGAFPKPAPVYREGDDAGGSHRRGGQSAVIAEYRALKKLQRSDEALQLLRRIGAVVRPIMLKHGWRLPLLVEMYPKNDNLLGLNVNRGQKIALRLRRPHNNADFIDEQSLTETMLHELTHNIRGPHDETFYKHLELLTQEWYDIRRNERLPGQGFWSPGQALSSEGKGARNPREAREKAVEMVRRREQLSARPGTYQLGGPSSAEHLLTPRELAAVAAERRKAIAAGCPSDNAERNSDAANEQEEQEDLQGTQILTIEIDSDSDREDDVDDFQVISDTQQPSLSKRPITNPAPLDDSDDDDVVVVDIKLANANWTDNTSNERTIGPRAWTCQACTLANIHQALACSACHTIRPGIANWTCRSCQHCMFGAFADFWCCSACGNVKIA